MANTAVTEGVDAREGGEAFFDTGFLFVAGFFIVAGFLFVADVSSCIRFPSNGRFSFDSGVDGSFLIDAAPPPDM